VRDNVILLSPKALPFLDIAGRWRWDSARRFRVADWVNLLVNRLKSTVAIQCSFFKAELGQ